MGERCSICGRLDSTANLSDINVQEGTFGICVRKSCLFLCRAFVMGCVMLHVHSILF